MHTTNLNKRSKKVEQVETAIQSYPDLNWVDKIRLGVLYDSDEIGSLRAMN